MPFADRSVQVGTRRVRFLETPSPAGVRARGTLLLLHAFPLSAEMWREQTVLAEGGWRLIAPHYRGFGAGVSEQPASTMDDYAADAVDLLDALHLDDVVVAGASMGGYAAFAVMRLAPRYVRGLVLSDTRPQADTPEGRARRKAMLGLIERGGAAAVADDMLPTLLGDTTRRERPDVVDRVRAMIIGNSPAAIAGAVTALMTRPDSTAILGSIHCPTLIVVGAEDRIAPPEVSAAMQRAIAGSTLVTIDRAGHLPNLEQRDAFNAALASFLAHQL